MGQAGVETVDQAAQRLRLIAGGLERRNELKTIGHEVLRTKSAIIACREVTAPFASAREQARAPLREPVARARPAPNHCAAG
jgi:hypothetical protein